jgi:hypothetical protein
MDDPLADSTSGRDWAGLYDRIPCHDADHLLNVLDARGPHFGNTPLPNRWIFRGQKDSTWPLLPSAFRLSTMQKLLGSARAPHHPNLDQIRMEFVGLFRFFESADRAGLSLPEDSQATRKVFHKIRTALAAPSGKLLWPPDELLSLLALAQHNGVPTRLLDWTWDAKIAAYFAVVNAAEHLKDHEGGKQVVSDHMCVWALSLTIFRSALESDMPSAEGFYLITAPTFANANLRAQRGAFVLHRPKGEIDFGPRFTCTPIEQKSELAGKSTDLVQFTLPVREAPRLLRLLAKDGICGAGLFPSYEGAAKAAREETWWDCCDPIWEQDDCRLRT